MIEPSTRLTAVVAERPLEVVARAAHEVVEDDDLPHRLLEQLIDDVRADESGAADDEDPAIRQGWHRRDGRGRPSGCCYQGRLMCGIAGVLNRGGDPVSKKILRRMGDAIAHRGPDGSGAVRRRAGRADQPAAGDHRPAARRARCRWLSESGRLAITYNGELYNFRELRAELRGAGPPLPHRRPTPRSCSRAYEEWGPGCARALQRHVRVRDLGRPQRASCSWPAIATASSRSTTPTSGDELLFGSEIKSLLEHPAFRARGEPSAPARVLHVPEHLHRRHAVRRGASCCRPAII